MVLKLGYPHLDRSINFDLSDAGAQVFALAREAKASVNGCLCAGWIVCIFFGTFHNIRPRIWKRLLTIETSVMITSILRLKSLLIISHSTDPTCEVCPNSSI